MVNRLKRGPYTQDSEEFNEETGILTIKGDIQPVKEFAIRNKSTANSLTFVINSVSVTLDPAPSTNSPFGISLWDDNFGSFSKVQFTGTDLDFEAYVRG